MGTSTGRYRCVLIVAGACLSAMFLACGDGDDGDTQIPADFVAQESDFECVKNWERIRNFRLTNTVGLLDEAMELARNPVPGKQYPVGTIIQVFPTEAMVKRGPDFDPANNNWEYFELRLSPAGIEIRKRGRDDDQFSR